MGINPESIKLVNVRTDRADRCPVILTGNDNGIYLIVSISKKRLTRRISTYDQKSRMEQNSQKLQLNFIKYYHQVEKT